MNRIILIGNGFDLAHSMKTSYADFIDWYWEYRKCGFCDKLGYVSEDPLCRIKIVNPIDGWNVIDFYLPRDFKKMKGKDVIQSMIDTPSQFKVEFCPFFGKIVKDIEKKGWVDVEDIYYAFLKSSDDPKLINEELDFIKNKLVEYLNTLPEPALNPIIKNQILEPITEDEIAVGSMDEFYKLRVTTPTFSPKYIMLLNFNYTNTSDIYLPKADRFSVNHIHGTLTSLQSVIFGYGDERDDEYEVLMKKNDNEYLQHIKSFRYLEASNYRNMLAFIESAPYQVCIMGHSCGLSDRTLLATLFEHKNCVSIKPYYYKKEDGTDNYRELVQNIARNFTSPSLMRDRVVRKDRCEALGCCL